MRISESIRRKIPERFKPSLWALLRILRRIILKFSGKYVRPARYMDIDDYEEWYYTRPQARKYLDDKKTWINLVDMIQYFKPNKVFEFGSGLGHLLKECQSRKIDIVGSETSDYAIKNTLCKEKVEKIGLIPESRLPFEDNSFDLIFSSEVMEHVEERYTEAVIRELNRICSNYTLLTINTFDYMQPGHINIHTRKWWLKKFEENGFEHDDEIWTELNKIKYKHWDIYVFKKINLGEAEKG